MDFVKSNSNTENFSPESNKPPRTFLKLFTNKEAISTFFQDNTNFLQVRGKHSKRNTEFGINKKNIINIIA